MIGGCFSISALALKLENIVYMNKGTKDPGSLHIGTVNTQFSNLTIRATRVECH